MEMHRTIEIVRELIGGGDSLHTIADVDWDEVCPGCADDIGVGDVVVFVADRWHHEDCTSLSEKASVMSRRRSGHLPSMQVEALYRARERTQEAPDPQVLAAAVPDCHITPVSGTATCSTQKVEESRPGRRGAAEPGGR